MLRFTDPMDASPCGRILIIEDSPVELATLADLLREAGYSVSAAKGGEEGLQRIQEGRPDLILLDSSVEGAEGLELCRRLMADPHHREIPVLLLTALRNPEDRLKALQAGAVDYVSKPYQGEEVLARIRAHLELRRRAEGLKGANQNLLEELEALRESHELLEVAVAQSPSGILIADAPDVTIRFANAAAFGIRGGDPQLLTGIDVSQHAAKWQIFRPDGRPYPSEELPLSRAVLRGETTRNEELVIRDEQGSAHWVSVNAAPIRNSEGRVSAGIAIFHDITEQKRTEETLRAERQRLSDIIEFLPDATFVIDHEKRVIAWNRAAEAMTGVKKEELLGQGDYAYAVPFFGERHPILIDLLDVASEPIERIYKYVRRSGEMIYAESFIQRLHGGEGAHLWGVAAPLYDPKGQRSGAIEVVRDVTESKRAEEALRLSMAQLRANLENTPNVAIQWYDEEGRVLYWNPATEAMYGWTAEEAMGKTLEEFFYSPEERAEFIRILEHIRATGSPVGPVELHVPRRDGTRIWVMSTTFTMPMGEGRTGFVSMDVDITERKRAEEGRERLNAQLLQAQKMEVVGRLAGGVAHDFNNMLGVILGRVDLVMNMVEPGDRICASLKEILKAAQHSADLTRQLLAFARKQTVAPRLLDLNDTVEGMLRMLRRLIGEDMDLAWMPSAGLWPIRMDPSQIDQILANLCVNARDAIQGGGRISIETKNAVVDADYCAAHFGAVSGEYVLLMVSDSGCGMGPEVLEHIFEPFFTTKGLEQGTGLGLATVYGIVRQNEGFINVYSEPGHGSSFKIYLPRTSAEAQDGRPEPAARMPRGHGETLLVAEDDEGLRKLSCEALAALGYWVLAAGSPEEALRLADASQSEVRLLITDMIMPGMNGRELAQRLCERKPGLKCLFISGYTADIIANQGILPEDVAFLQKPFSLRDLAAKVHEVLESG